MKRRVIHPYKILAVALGAAGVGCTTTPRPDPTPSTTAPSTTAPSIAAAPAPSPAPVPPEGVAQHAPPADDKADRKLLALRDELDRTLPAEVVAKEAHFRPLCDKDGYPLVGNLNRKAPSPGTVPSAFCASVRSPKKPS